MKLKTIIAGALVGGAAVMGISLGAGHAEAKIEPGKYKEQTFVYGFIPLPESNVRVIGNTKYQDYYGVGPWNLSHGTIIPRTYGGTTAVYGDNPISLWYDRVDYRKTPHGYKGTGYGFGVPTIDYNLKKVR
ncbi:hypothetical protein AAFP30_24825 [Gordonia sp. CPCC 205515]|uniref:hypothetical protein n=1 Tax=Gordonia sp. CPCC 205515 TaxID=3140791 RepID=UPI003AF3739E